MSTRHVRVCNALDSLWNYQSALRTQVYSSKTSEALPMLANPGQISHPKFLAVLQENLASLVGHQGVADTLLLVQVCNLQRSVCLGLEVYFIDKMDIKPFLMCALDCSIHQFTPLARGAQRPISRSADRSWRRLGLQTYKWCREEARQPSMVQARCERRVHMQCKSSDK